MRRSDRWWHREIEKVRREAAVREDRLIAAIAHLSGNPFPADTVPAEPEPDDEVALVVPDYLENFDD